MLRKLYPREYYTSTYIIDFEQYYRMGYRAVLFDVDNTLVEHDAPANDAAKQLMKRLIKIGFCVGFISNNDEERVERFREDVLLSLKEAAGKDLPPDDEAEKYENRIIYIHKAGKPLPKGYREAMKQFSTNENNTLFVGDQLFTDIWGARKAGIRAFLVLPISPAEEIQVILKRRLEWIVLAFFRRKLKREGKAGMPEGHFQRPGRARITGSITGDQKSVEK